MYSFTVVTVQAVKCPPITVGDDVQVTGDSSQTSYMSVLQFGCRTNLLVLYGPSYIRCEADGNWNAQPPRCDVVKCKAPMIHNGKVDNNEYAEGDGDEVDMVPGPSESPVTGAAQCNCDTQ
ncbi:hypothetical protein NHX12_033157 [Muraenolepis orangiensis]|uniref:Sushi domain-containing protein n=1 Tax=Muraenolepis orangiensis TaxID=630683 RepID=A0A9Q0E150_9TELE|nr:hypothetical protein NHX12_033157 [Muraenolepis orangiensis]